MVSATACACVAKATPTLRSSRDSGYGVQPAIYCACGISLVLAVRFVGSPGTVPGRNVPIDAAFRGIPQTGKISHHAERRSVPVGVDICSYAPLHLRTFWKRAKKRVPSSCPWPLATYRFSSRTRHPALVRWMQKFSREQP
jgi:hypothetical protein